MSDVININKINEVVDADNSKIIGNENDLIKLTDDILIDTRTDITEKDTMSIPIAQLAALGAGVSALIPALRTVTQKTTLNTTGLYRLANAGVGDVLKKAKDGTNWGALKTLDGKSKMAKFQEMGAVSGTSSAIMPIDPVTVMMAVALASIENQLNNIAEMQKQILSFLETEKESEIEADVETLTKIISDYKFNWDNSHFVTSNHKLALDIKRTSKKHMISYQKKVNDILNSNQFLVFQSAVKSTLNDLIKKFKYYRLTLYTFSMSSLAEIMLSGNFKEEYINSVIEEIESNSFTYRDLHTKCSAFLEKMSNSSLETNFLKGIGGASKAVGQFIGNIPFIKEGPVDEFLHDSGSQLENTAGDMEKDILKAFAEISNPNTKVFIEKMKDILRIYNHTSEICFDKDNIYLIAG